LIAAAFPFYKLLTDGTLLLQLFYNKATISGHNTAASRIELLTDETTRPNPEVWSKGELS
jgi:hypothetical protein